GSGSDRVHDSERAGIAGGGRHASTRYTDGISAREAGIASTGQLRTPTKRLRGIGGRGSEAVWGGSGSGEQSGGIGDGGRATLSGSVAVVAGCEGEDTGASVGIGGGALVCGAGAAGKIRVCTNLGECFLGDGDLSSPGWDSSGIGIGGGTASGIVRRA